MRTVRVGILKAIPRKWDKDANWRTMERLIRDASHFKIDVAVTPECFLDGYVVGVKDWTRESFAEIAEDENDGAYIKKISLLAKELGINIIAGLTEKRDERFFNAAYLFSRDGSIVGKYHKIHSNEKYCAGDSLPVFNTDFGRIGILICADRHWPENARVLMIRGAEIIFLPSYGMWHEKNTMWMRTRSFENGMYICFAHPNIALITDPRGDISAQLISNVENFLIHDLDLDLVNNVLGHGYIEKRRPELYADLCEI